MKPNHSDLGFTLTEVLVMLALIAIITTFAFGGLSFGMRTWEKGTAASDVTIRYSRSAAYIRNLIEQAYPLPAASGHTTPKHVAFSGASDRLMFLAPLNPGGHHRVTLRLQDGRLVLSRHGASDAGAALGLALLDHIKRVEFSYYGALRDGQAPAWHDRWQDASALPALVRLRIEPEDGTPRWPDLVAAPRISSDSRCVFVPIPGDCIYK